MCLKQLFVGLFSLTAVAIASADELASFVDAHCVQCHDAQTSTTLNFEALSSDFSQAEVRKHWINAFDRIESGEMPPADEPQPDPALRQRIIESLRKRLTEADLAEQNAEGRVPFRRLTNTEFSWMVRDLLDVAIDVGGRLPPEANTNSFDTVGATQRLSNIHLQSYLKAADEALDHAICLKKNPYHSRQFDLKGNLILRAFHELPINMGGGITLPHGDGALLFIDADYLIRAAHFGFFPSVGGTYRITTEVSSWQATKPLTAKLIRREPSGAATLLKAVDLNPDETKTFVVDAWFNPLDDFYLTFEMGPTKIQDFKTILKLNGVKDYKGQGIYVRSQSVEGPINETWPPPSTTRLLDGINLTSSGDDAGPFEVSTPENPVEEIRKTLHRFVRQAYRRPVEADDVNSYVALAEAQLSANGDYAESLKWGLRAVLASPEFIIDHGDAGKLNGFQLADRLARFLWKSVPDKQLQQLAASGRLLDPSVLHDEVERMLDDDRSARFVHDFVGQWLRVHQVNETTPDTKLFPEFDELLKTAIPQEPELFFTEFIRQNLPARQLLDADFTFVNSRLATHYGLEGIAGQNFRRVDLPADSPRGGILTQAAILKTTANGTKTSPVVRGNFVLTNVLGQPTPPPPSGVEGVEPDVRGSTTIRELLEAHRNNDACSQCHNRLDPPGFALEGFNAIGGQRTTYYAKKGITRLPVDTSGRFADGREFADVQEFKRLLSSNDRQFTTNLISRLVVYSTGGEIRFADRKDIQSIIDDLQSTDFRVRDIIHAVVQSRMFRNR